MRILHTSDWHLGRSFGDHRLLDDQAQFLDWLVEVVAIEHIDLVAISGDLFDRSVPPADAVELFHETLRRLLATGTDVAAIAGNHDSAERIGSLDGLLTDGLIVRGGFGRSDQVERRHYDDGPLAIVAMPFLDPAFAPRHDDAAGVRTHETVLAQQLDAVRREIAPDERTLVLAHAFVTGAEPSASERTLAVGDAGMVSSSIFADFDYVALGHLHRSQTVAGDERVRYSGAPLPYSFGESHGKDVVIIELDADGDARPKPLTIDVGKGVATITGQLEELLARPGNDRDWVRVELTDSHPVADAHRRLRDHFPHLVEITRAASTRKEALNRPTAATMRERSPGELARTFLETVDDDIADDHIELVQEALVEASAARQ